MRSRDPRGRLVRHAATGIAVVAAAFVAAAPGLSCNGSGDAAPVDASSTAADAGDPWSACGPLKSYPPGDDGGCGPGAVTFQLTGPPGVEWWVDEDEGTNSPSTNWLTLFACDSQTQLELTPTEQTTSRDCGTCPTTWSLTLGTASFKLPAAGQTQTWDGTYYVNGTCGTPAMACVSTVCAQAGRYVAQMCGCAPADQTPNSCLNPVCVQVGFDYPAQQVVSGILPTPNDD